VLLSKRGLKILFAISLLPAIGLAGCFSNPFDIFGGGGSGISIKTVTPTPANPTISVGASQTFVANATLSDGSTATEPESSTTWTSSDTGVATIDDSGVATGVAAGTTTIEAKVKSVSGTTVLTITAAAESSMSVRGSFRVLTVSYPGVDREYVFAGNALDDTISVFRVLDSGEERSVGRFSSAPSRGPLWLAVDSSGRFLYVANQQSRDISVYSIDARTGRLSAVRGSPFPMERAGDGPWAISVDASGHFVDVAELKSAGVVRYQMDPLSGALSLDETSK
jgi:DNA-binding beta-propeller fold protein YncE